VRRIEAKWAGLRCFASDRNPVIGFDSRVDSFFWVAGQGGYGVQTCWSVAEIAVAALTGKRIPQSVIDHGVLMQDFAPSRFDLDGSLK
jgi:D-arginine dehydrogenase